MSLVNRQFFRQFSIINGNDFQCQAINLTLAMKYKVKIKKSDDTYELIMQKNPDILAEVSALYDAPFTVGFAAETENLELNAQTKLHLKNLDMIAANQVDKKLGIDCVENSLTIFWKTGREKLPLAPKNKLARSLIKLIAFQYNEKNSNKTH